MLILMGIVTQLNFRKTEQFTDLLLGEGDPSEGSFKGIGPGKRDSLKPNPMGRAEEEDAMEVIPVFLSRWYARAAVVPE